MTRAPAETRILCLCASPARGGVLEALVNTVMPSAHVSLAAGAPTGTLAAGIDVIIIDAVPPGADTNGGDDSSAGAAVPEVELVRRVRAGAFTGGIVVLADPSPSIEPELSGEELGRLGATLVTEQRLAATLLDTVRSGLASRSGEPGAAALLAHLDRTRQVLAAGEIALGLQHALNNPLAAILAESQLLEMDPLPDEQRKAVGRIVALCRRMIAIVRRLDGVGGASGGARLPPAGK